MSNSQNRVFGKLQYNVAKLWFSIRITVVIIVIKKYHTPDSDTLPGLEFFQHTRRPRVPATTRHRPSDSHDAEIPTQAFDCNRCS